jgi:hypothetical protein
MDEARPPNITKELALLLLLATLWGGSYTFIKLCVATIPCCWSQSCAGAA